MTTPSSLAQCSHIEHRSVAISAPSTSLIKLWRYSRFFVDPGPPGVRVRFRSIGRSIGRGVCRKAGQNVRIFEDKIALTDDFRFSLDDASIIAGLENKATRSGGSE